MASIRLGRYEVEEEGLPAVCMRCGEPATVTVHKTFRWYPSWVFALIFAGLLPYVIVASVLTKRMGVPVSFCARHKGHWIKRGLLVSGTLMALIACLVAVVAL